MKALVVLTLAATSTTFALAQEQGRVLSTTPITQQVAVPQQVCNDQQVAVAPRPTGAGAVVGALAGGVLGNVIGSGGGRAAATAAGAVGGALLGNQVEASAPVQYQTVRQCGTQNYYQSQTTGYNVVYEYRGRNYTTQTATPPGDWIDLSVQPANQYNPPQTAYNNSAYNNGAYNNGGYNNGYDNGYNNSYGNAYPNDGYNNGAYNNGAYSNGYDNGYGYNNAPVYPAQPVYTAPAPAYSAASIVGPVLLGAAIGAGAYYATRPSYYYRGGYHGRHGGWRR